MSKAEDPTFGVVDWLKKRLPINTHSLPEFIEAIRDLNGTCVEGAVIIKVQNLLAGRKTAPELEPIGLRWLL